MTNSTLTFNSDQIEDRKTLTAIVVGFTDSQKGKPHPPSFGGYGITIAGNGKTITHWGAGYARSQFPFVAAGIEHILRLNTEKQKVLIHAERGIENHIKYPGGHIWAAKKNGGLKTNNKPYEGFPTLIGIAEPFRKGDWKLVPLNKKTKPLGYRAAFDAAEEGIKYVIKHQWEISEIGDFQILATDEKLLLNPKA